MTMVFILHRYIFRELFKVFVLTTTALTLILTLGSILQPIQQYGLGPQRVVDIIIYFLPIALTFVLPMAALFAAALVYGRLAGDNELDACRASGIGLMTLVYPGFALAIMIAIANVILSFHALPYFVHLAEKSLKADAKQILFRNIQRKGYYKPPDGKYLIYADQANPKSETLSGLIVVEAKDGKAKKIITAENARIHFDPHERFNEVHLAAHNISQMAAEDDMWISAEWLSVRQEFGPLLGDDIRFKNVEQIKKIQADLMRFYPVERLARQVYTQFTAELLAQDITAKVVGNPGSFYELPGRPNSVKFSASQCNVQGEKGVRLSGDVIVTEYDTRKKQPLQTLRCAEASLHIEGDELAPTLTIDIYNARVEGTGDLKRRHVIRGLIPPKVADIRDMFETENVLSAIAKASQSSVLQKQPSPALTDMLNKLNQKIQKTLVEIRSEKHSRLVFGIGCVPMIMIGIAAGIIKKGGHILSAFGLSCVPAVVLVVGIISGKHITENPSSQSISGIVLMWLTVGFLMLVAVTLFYRLLKN